MPKRIMISSLVATAVLAIPALASADDGVSVCNEAEIPRAAATSDQTVDAPLADVRWARERRELRLMTALREPAIGPTMLSARRLARAKSHINADASQQLEGRVETPGSRVLVHAFGPGDR